MRQVLNVTISQLDKFPIDIFSTQHFPKRRFPYRTFAQPFSTPHLLNCSPLRYKYMGLASFMYQILYNFGPVMKYCERGQEKRYDLFCLIPGMK